MLQRSFFRSGLDSMSSKVGETMKSSPSNKLFNSQKTKVALRSEETLKSFVLKGSREEEVTTP